MVYFTAGTQIYENTLEGYPKNEPPVLKNRGLFLSIMSAKK
jgi:hypothetical protein